MDISPELLSRLFGITYRVIKSQTEGLTDQDSLLQPPFRGNCLNWVLGHIVTNRNRVLLLLDESPIWSEAEMAAYKTGSQPIAHPGENIHSLEKILSSLDQSQERLIAALQRVSQEKMEATIDEETMGQQLAGLHFHESYHTGQTELLRQLAGKNDAIV
jgi:hypothetical protein